MTNFAFHIYTIPGLLKGGQICGWNLKSTCSNIAFLKRSSRGAQIKIIALKGWILLLKSKCSSLRSQLKSMEYQDGTVIVNLVIMTFYYIPVIAETKPLYSIIQVKPHVAPFIMQMTLSTNHLIYDVPNRNNPRANTYALVYVLGYVCLFVLFGLHC